MSDLKLMKEMGDRIYNRRRSLKLTQEELAEILGVSSQMISNLELGKKAIRPENLVKLCKALEVSADYILTGKNTDNYTEYVSEKLFSLNQKELDMINSFIDYMNTKK